mmetsp:Transcript_12977/g.21945  ORF Transcript_12977/g.21945 Transcript_12977/m.21945 type:complete len:186 (-) Transcript_12977:155-712(-)
MGMVFSVPDTIEQVKGLYTGFLIGMYHNPDVELSKKCLDRSQEDKVKYVLDMIYNYHNILHFIDAIKMTEKAGNLIQSIFEDCGYNQMSIDIKQFCKFDEDRCKTSTLLTNVWWRLFVIGAQSLRVTIDSFELIYYAIDKEKLKGKRASMDTAMKLFDIGDDLGSIFRYILDFHVDEDLVLGEFA